jgi:hypothetical protein
MRDEVPDADELRDEFATLDSLTVGPGGAADPMSGMPWDAAASGLRPVEQWGPPGPRSPEQQAAFLKNSFTASIIHLSAELPAFIETEGVQLFLDNLVKEMGAQGVPILARAIQFLTAVEFRAAGLHVRSAQAANQAEAETYLKGAARLTGEYGRLWQTVVSNLPARKEGAAAGRTSGRAAAAKTRASSTPRPSNRPKVPRTGSKKAGGA